MIEVRELSKRYGDTVALDRVSFDVPAGVVTGFLGPNGAGKSTAMRMILGLDLPTAGSATIGGRAYRDLPAPLREVGALLDAKAVHPARTARAHLRWLARAGGIAVSRVEEVLGLVGLGDVGGRRAGGFSLGMSQRLGIAAALLGDPGTLLLDEPVNGLDPEGILWVRTLLRRLAAEGRTVVVSSHLMNEMQETADHVLVLGRGRLLADADIGEFTRRSAAGQVRVVSPDAGRLAALLAAAGGTAAADPDGALLVTGLDAARVGDLAAEHRLRLHELIPRRASLEAAYLELTRPSAEYRAAGPAGPEPATATDPEPEPDSEPDSEPVEETRDRDARS
jgi:ABC-2 type transport system ATP-binding protein